MPSARTLGSRNQLGDWTRIDGSGDGNILAEMQNTYEEVA